MALTTYGSPYVDGTDLVANWPAASLTVAQSIDAAGYYIGRGNNTQTGSYTTVLTDAGKVITMSNASANTVTIPANSSVAYVIGTRINILNLGAGACTPTAGAGVTINGTITALATNGSASVIKTATNTWSYITAGTGKIIQVVNASTATQATNNTNVYADTGLTATITPTLNTSTILVNVALCGVGKASSDTAVETQLLRGATVLALTSVFASLSSTTGQTGVGGIPVTFLDSPATTSATTYKMQFRSWANSARARVQESSATSTITLMEVSA
jgi:hypothetical protein